MKKVLLVIIMVLLVFPVIANAKDTLYQKSITITEMIPDTPNSNLLEIPMGGKAGYITSIACSSGLSADYDVFLYDNDWDGDTVDGSWYLDVSNRTSANIIVWSGSASTSELRDDITVPSFTCQDSTLKSSLFLGVYNDQPTVSNVSVSCDIEFVLRRYGKLPAVTQ